MFRLDRLTFDDLTDQLTHIIQRNENQAMNSSGQRLFTAKEEFVLWPTIEALDSLLKIGLRLEDNAMLEELAEGFRNHSGGIFDKCILAMDGLAVRTRYPFRWEA